MRRIIVVLTITVVVVTSVATFGASASAQSPCPPTGTSGGPATLVNAEEPVGAGFVCLDEEAQEFFCPPELELQLFPVLPGESPGPAFIAECGELSPPSDGGGGGVELTQEDDQQAEAGEIDQSVGVY